MTFQLVHYKTVMDKRVAAPSGSESDLFKAIKEHDAKQIQSILREKQVNVNTRDETGHTFLGLAASSGFLEGMSALLEAGCMVNAVDFYGLTPLQYAASSGQLDALKLLLEHGADVNWMDENRQGLSAIHLATLDGHQGIVEALIKAKADVNVKDSNGISVLHCAVGNGHHDIVKMLLKAKARVNVRGVKSGRTPLFVAAEVGDVQILNMLIKAGARVNIPNDYGMTPLCAVCLQNNSQVASCLLEAGAGSKVNLPDDSDSIPLHYAARFGNTKIVEALLGKGSELDKLNDYFESPLHLAVRNCHLEAVRVLVDHGCDVNICEAKGMVTALHVAVNSCMECETFSQLLEALICGGCMLDSCAFVSMETPLFRAMNLEKVDFAVALLQHGSNPNTECPFDQTVLQKACEKRWINLINLLLHCELDWMHENWLDTDIHMSGINPKLLKGYARHVPTVLLNNVDLYFKILQVRCNPVRLIDMCRWSIRRYIGSQLFLKLKKTQLPPQLQDFCMMKTV